MGSHRRSPRLLLAGSLVLLVVILAQGAREKRFPEQTQTLNSGEQVKLVRVTYRSPHRVSTGNALTQLAAPFAPAALQTAWGYGSFSRPEVPLDVPVVWLYHRLGGQEKWSGIGSLNGIQLWTIGDDDGCETQLDGWGTHHLSGDRWGVTSYALYGFPRRRGRVAVRGYSWTANPTPTLEFRIPNLAPGPHPQWEAASLPVTVSDGDVQYALRRFVTGADISSDRVPPRLDNRRDASTHLEIDAIRNGEPAYDWMPVSFELIDPTGNRFRAGAYGNPRRTGHRTHLALAQNLFQKETTWLVRAEVARTRTAAFSPEEIYTLTGLPMPSREHPALEPVSPTPEITRTINGVSVTVSGVAWDSMGPPYANLHLRMSGIPLSGHRVTLLSAQDEQGRRAPVTDREPSYTEFKSMNPPEIIVRLPFEVRKPMKAVNVTIAVQKTRFVEFLASPTRPAPVGGQQSTNAN